MVQDATPPSLPHPQYSNLTDGGSGFAVPARTWALPPSPAGTIVVHVVAFAVKVQPSRGAPGTVSATTSE